MSSFGFQTFKSYSSNRPFYGTSCLYRHTCPEPRTSLLELQVLSSFTSENILFPMTFVSRTIVLIRTMIREPSTTKRKFPTCNFSKTEHLNFLNESPKSDLFFLNELIHCASFLLKLIPNMTKTLKVLKSSGPIWAGTVQRVRSAPGIN